LLLLVSVIHTSVSCFSSSLLLLLHFCTLSLHDALPISISNGAQALWGAMKAVWDGIMAVIKPVVDWLQTWVWPVIEMVLALIKLGFETWRDAIKAAWGFVKNNVIAPVVSWFQNTAWPLIRTVIEAIKLGFNVMRDALKAAWQFVKDR